MLPAARLRAGSTAATPYGMAVMGMLLRPLDAILSSQSKVRLLRALLPIGDGVSARHAARLAGVPFPPALRALADLSALGVLHREELSSQHLYTVDHDNPLVRDGLMPLFEAERRRVSAVFAWLRETLQEELADGTVRSVVLYGSAARGDDRPGSDFDLLAVVATDEAVHPVHSRLANLAPELERLFALDLSPMVLSLARLREQLAGGDPVMAAAIREGRDLAGEPLYALLPAEVEG
jgi:predicted nucleotidyltransferase